MKDKDGWKTIGRTELKDGSILDDANPEHDLSENETEAPSTDVRATNDQYSENKDDVEITLEVVNGEGRGATEATEPLPRRSTRTTARKHSN